MSTMWWMEPGWKSAVCGCGANIWNSGGDPDWGRCWPCMQRETERTAQRDREEREYYEAMEREHYAALYSDACEPWFDASSFDINDEA